MNNFRPLCAELIAALEQCPVTSDAAWIARRMDIIHRTRTELNKPEPAELTEEKGLQAPTLEDIRAMAAEYGHRTPEDFALAVLARWGQPAITTPKQ